VPDSGSVLLLPDLLWTGTSDDVHRGIGLLISQGKVVDIVQPNAPVPLSTTRIRLPKQLLTPGLTNSHAHLELSNIPRPPYPGSFLNWLGQVMAKGPKTPEEAALAALEGARESAAFGVTRLVDITRFPAATRAALATTGLAIQSCGEVTGLAKRWNRGFAMRDSAVQPDGLSGSRVQLGISPHAPYSTAADWYKTTAADARNMSLTFTTHLAETHEERQFLASHTGPFRDLWNALGDWEDGTETFPAGPVRWLESHGVLKNTRLLAAHVNDVDDEELAILAAHDVTVVHCPRTHAYFQRPPFDLPKYLRAGVKVTLGTDSTASSGDLNLMADVRLFHSQNPALSAQDAFGYALTSTLAPGQFADAVAWPVSSLEDLLSRPEVVPTRTWLAGVPAASE
jgi:cytosine/adenosine deaminase-related metal-dependent hydrolase